uniref:Uncharacterized protein n=1 Tax=Lepeophtheirus salmonis TaxID=72036 RepID=A0A0K2VDD8_LEPSM
MKMSALIHFIRLYVAKLKVLEKEMRFEDRISTLILIGINIEETKKYLSCHFYRLYLFPGVRGVKFRRKL